MEIPDTPVVIRNVRLTNDRTIDCTSLDGIIRGAIRPDMTDKQKAHALWDFLRLRTFHKSPGVPSPEMANPVTILNHHGQMQCGVCNTMLCGLMRHAGIPAARGGAIGHSIMEAFYDGAWHMYDSDMHDYYIKEDGTVASIYEIANIPGLRFGPENKSYPWYNGHDWLYSLAGTYAPGGHGDFKNPRPADEEYVNRYSKNPGWKWKYDLELRPGTEITWSWFPDPDVGYARINYVPDEMKERAAKDLPWPDAMRGGLPWAPLQSVAGFGANGRLTLDLGPYTFVHLAENARNVMPVEKGIRLKDPGAPGAFDVNMKMPYYFADGWIEGALPAGGLTIEWSSGNGERVKIWPKGDAVPGKRLRMYREIALKFEGTLHFTMAPGTELDGLRIVGVFHHNHTVLPALLKGRNLVKVNLDYAGVPESDRQENPVSVAYVYDQRTDDGNIVRRTVRHEAPASRGSSPDNALIEIDTGEKHWPLMREIRIDCKPRALGGREPAYKPLALESWADWGAYPWSTAYHGMNYYNDFERGDKDGWRGKLVTSPTYDGSDFALDNDIIRQDGSSEFKIIRNIGVNNHNSRLRFACYVRNVESVRFYTQDRSLEEFADREKQAWYEYTWTGLKQGEWNVLECGLDDLTCPKYPGRPFPERGRLGGFYFQAKKKEGAADTAVKFVMDNFACWDEGVTEEDPWPRMKGPRAGITPE
ncbi:MAG: transglutaminase domain-containing protein [Planctomycetes bacterium]|nr:transglutaminase domain-containing protein [Planctomycetota bacterium]